MAGRKRTEEEKSRIIAEYRESGRSARDFCRNLDLHDSSLLRWIRERRRRECSDTEHVTRGESKKQPLVAVSPGTAGLSERNQQETREGSRENSREDAVFRMHISSRIILEIPLDAEADQLQAIFQAAGAL